MGEVIGNSGGVEIECWREVVPVLFHEARRLTVHVQFRSIKFSLLRREFHIKLSSEEDHCFLYKAAVTEDVYQRFAHYHNLDVPFEQFSEYMHHLIHSVKNQDYGDRFFINILAPQTQTHLPQSIEFIVTQGQMGCLVQCRRLSLTFTLASDAELKEHLMSCFDRLKREKDMAQRRCNELENELMNERAKSKELDERNRYFQRELEFSQTLIKSAETIQRHYESLLKQQHHYKQQLLTTSATALASPPLSNQFQHPAMNLQHHHFANHPHHVTLLEGKSSILSHPPIHPLPSSRSSTVTISPSDVNLLMPDHFLQLQGHPRGIHIAEQKHQHHNQSSMNHAMNSTNHDDPDPHLDNVINFLTSNCAHNNNMMNNNNINQQQVRVMTAAGQSSLSPLVVENDNQSLAVTSTNRRLAPAPILTVTTDDVERTDFGGDQSNSAMEEDQSTMHELVTPTAENPPISHFDHIDSHVIHNLDNQSSPSVSFASRCENSNSNYNNSPRQSGQASTALVTILPASNVAITSNNNNVNINNNNGNNKLKGAAKRKASFHNLTNSLATNQVNSSLEQQQGRSQLLNDHVTEHDMSRHVTSSQQQHNQSCQDPSTDHVRQTKIDNRITTPGPSSMNNNDIAQARDERTLLSADLMYCERAGHVTMNSLSNVNNNSAGNNNVIINDNLHSNSGHVTNNNNNNMDASIADALNNILDKRPIISVVYQEQPEAGHQEQQRMHHGGHNGHQQHVTFMEANSYREYCGDLNRVVSSNASMSPTLGSTNNELIDNLSGLTEADWRNMKMEYDPSAMFPADLAEMGASGDAPSTLMVVDPRVTALTLQQQDLPPSPPSSGVAPMQPMVTATLANHQRSIVVTSPIVETSAIMTSQIAMTSPSAAGCLTSSSPLTYMDRTVTPTTLSNRLHLGPQQQTTVDPRCLTPMELAAKIEESNYQATVPPETSQSPDSKTLSMDGVLSYFKCLICDRSFSVGSSHMAQHVTDSQTCSFCNDSSKYETKDELIKHMMSHSARIYACQYCGKENPRVHYLKIHVRSHTGEKPYTCHQCGRGFADASTWRRHERVHTGEKPYQCNICGRKIARRDNVKIHMRSHMRTKHNASCRICGKGFSQPNHLMLHERVCMSTSGSSSPGARSPLVLSNDSSGGELSTLDILLPGSPVPDVKCKHNALRMSNVTPSTSASSPMNIIAAIEADTGNMASLQHAHNFVP